MPIQESGEMYLETILILSEKNRYVRSLDVAEYMGYSKPSISRAMGLLKEGGYVEADEDGYLSLTEQGKEVAQKIYNRHRMLTAFLQSIGVSEKSADTDACRIEHVISDETFEAICRHVSDNL